MLSKMVYYNAKLYQLLILSIMRKILKLIWIW